MTFPCDTPFFDEIIIDQMIEKTTNTKEKIIFIKDKKQRHNIFGTWSKFRKNIRRGFSQ